MIRKNTATRNDKKSIVYHLESDKWQDDSYFIHFAIVMSTRGHDNHDKILLFLKPLIY